MTEREGPKCVWVRRADVCNQFATAIEALVEQIYIAWKDETSQTARLSDQSPIYYILLAHAENVPTRMLRKFLVAPQIRRHALAGLIAEGETITAGDLEEAGCMLSGRTALVFFDQILKSGIP